MPRSLATVIVALIALIAGAIVVVAGAYALVVAGSRRGIEYYYGP